MALSCRIFSLVHLLVDYAFGAAIGIAYCDRGSGDEDSRDGVRSAVRPGQAAVAPQKQLLLIKLLH